MPLYKGILSMRGCTLSLSLASFFFPLVVSAQVPTSESTTRSTQTPENRNSNAPTHPAVVSTLDAIDEPSPCALDETSSGIVSPVIRFCGNTEAVYSYNFNNPSNGITNWRYYDIRHNAFNLQGAMLTAVWRVGPSNGHHVNGSLQLQFGALAELFWNAGRGPELDLLWRLLQQVTVEWRTPFRHFSIEGGLFNVPFGPEYNSVYLNWNWSTSNLFAMMPFQMAGFRASIDLGRGFTARLGAFNGWDQIVLDNNPDKTFAASIEWEHPNDAQTYVIANYMFGNERSPSDARGPYWRHAFDVYGQWHVIPRLSLRAHIFAGLEPTAGTTIDGWFGTALFAKLAILPWLSTAVRGDIVRVFSGPTGQNLFHAEVLTDPTASTLLGSVTLTVEFHPIHHASLRVEARHDQADFPLFYGGMVPRLPMDAGDRTNRNTQTTITAGLTAWF